MEKNKVLYNVKSGETPHRLEDWCLSYVIPTETSEMTGMLAHSAAVDIILAVADRKNRKCNISELEALRTVEDLPMWELNLSGSYRKHLLEDTELDRKFLKLQKKNFIL